MKRVVFLVVLTIHALFFISCGRKVIVTNGPAPKPAEQQVTPKNEEVKREEPVLQEEKTDAEKETETVKNSETENNPGSEKKSDDIKPSQSTEKVVPHTEPSAKDTKSSLIYYEGRVVILTYHHISTKPVSSITIKPGRFEADLKMLKDNNFNVISFKEMIDAMEGVAKLPPNAVVITFDDGYESFYKYGYPLLKKYNMKATNYVITSWTENYTPSGRELNSLSPEQIKEMYDSGLIDIQSHTHNSHDYIIRNEKGQSGGLLAYQRYDKASGKYESEEDYRKRVLEDLQKSISIIEKYTGQRSDALCFPFGHYNSRLVELSKQAGFKYLVTTIYGSNKENSRNSMIWRIRSGDSNLNPEKLKQNIINCGQGKPLSK